MGIDHNNGCRNQYAAPALNAGVLASAYRVLRVAEIEERSIRLTPSQCCVGGIEPEEQPRERRASASRFRVERLTLDLHWVLWTAVIRASRSSLWCGFDGLTLDAKFLV